MNDLTACQHVRLDLGVYMLGAINPAERAEVDAHLAVCPGCREEVAGLAGLPALLGRVPATEAARIAEFDHNERLAPGQDVPQAGDAPDVLTPLFTRMAQRRVSRWRNLAAAAALVIAAGGAAAGAVSMTSSPASPATAGRWENAAAASTGTQASADIRYAGMPSGIKLDVRVHGIRPGTTCQFWVLGGNGQRWPAGSWTVPRGWQSPWYQATSAAPLSRVHAFQITSGRTVLVAVKA
jgi:anti-sigma factor RsiW